MHETTTQQRLGLLATTMRAFAEATADHATLLETIARETAVLLGSFCSVTKLTDDGNCLLPVASYDAIGEKCADIETLIGKISLATPAGTRLREALRTGGQVQYSAAQTEQVDARYAWPLERETAEHLVIRNLLFIPLRARAASIGGLCIVRYGELAAEFSEDAYGFAQQLADNAALALFNGDLLLSVREELNQRRKAEEVLRRTEEQLRHTQKMDAVGRLAGGIAHDFNNLLSVIMSCCAFLSEELPTTPTLQSALHDITAASERAAELTRQLLSFSRQQPPKPQVVDVHAVLQSLATMIPRLVGEDIRFEMRLAPELGRAFLDAGHVEQVVLNLVVNARDAMPTGGSLVIVAENAELGDPHTDENPEAKPGPYIRVTVSDSGSGMSIATQRRIFEPFFTTKEVGKGTGLGLSVAFGIVKQCGGTISVTSEERRGTSFRVYLPRTTEEPNEPVGATVSSLEGTETVLVVEDDEQVRRVVADILLRRGYAVLDAGDGLQALRKLEQHDGPLHLLLVDVVMPNMSGRELADRVLAMRPEVRTIFMSGFTDDAVLRHRVLAAEVNFLEKPVTLNEVLEKVRSVLDAKAPTLSNSSRSAKGPQ